MSMKNAKDEHAFDEKPIREQDGNRFSSACSYSIYIGLKDKDDYLEYMSADEFISLVEKTCTAEGTAFSAIRQIGGYTHDKGYTTETSLRIDVIGASLDEVKALASELKRVVNTDTVMITREEISTMYC